MRFITMYEAWVYHNEPEPRLRLNDSMNLIIQLQNEFVAQKSPKKVTVSVFWNTKIYC